MDVVFSEMLCSVKDMNVIPQRSRNEGGKMWARSTGLTLIERGVVSTHANINAITYTASHEVNIILCVNLNAFTMTWERIRDIEWKIFPYVLS